MSKFIVIIAAFLIACIFAIGLIFSTEMVLRFFSPVISNGMLVDVNLFPYKHYVVSTHPANLKVGLG